MPVKIDDLATAKKTTAVSPKQFFSSKLTGVGKTTGILNEARNPVHTDKKQRTSNENINCRKHKFTNGQVDVTLIPTYVLTKDAHDSMDRVKMPEQVELALISENTTTGEKAYVHMTVHSIILEEMHTGIKGQTKKTVTPCYRLGVYLVRDANDRQTSQLYAMGNRRASGMANASFFDYTCNPSHRLNLLIDELEALGHTVDKQAIIDFIGNYSLYAGVCRACQDWMEKIDEILDEYFENIAQFHYANTYLNEVSRILHHLESYNVPLDLYRKIYASVKKHFKDDDAIVLCKQNLNLLLSDTLNNLNANKAQLTAIPQPSSAVVDPMFTREQRNAISTTEPLVLVQAGAGTGKSSVILGRIDYLIDSGVNPDDITVLSFTNAAADNITNHNARIHSMTIARMVHTIYTENFKSHELSSLDTIINSLDIYFPNDDFARLFARKLQTLNKNEEGAFTRANNFIEQNYDAVMTVLDTIQQTSLELEIIICYQQIENLSEPADIQSKYLIIDEVQDNSIFEFVYTLKYVDKHKEALFLVGDCSQTLYEFRSANPKALNVLEGSGVFATYQLQTNFRSNQEILDFANVALADIEANQYANIQLHANSLAPITEQSFCEKVHLRYERLDKIRDMDDAMRSIMATDVRKYIDDCLARGEQVAFMAFTRFHVARIQECLERMYPNHAIASLVSEKQNNFTVFSQFIKRYWGEVQFIPPRSIINIVSQEIMNRLDHLVYSADKMRPYVQNMLGKWRSESQATIDNWQKQYMSGYITMHEFLGFVRENMLQFEIRNNAIKQALLSARNAEAKMNDAVANANFILSTIHSAKGLEFPNVVVLYRNDNTMDEDKKRMYYVAFTRAMNSEFIMAFDTVVSPKIQADYDTIVEGLHQRALAQAGAAYNGVTVVDGSNEE